MLNISLAHFYDKYDLISIDSEAMATVIFSADYSSCQFTFYAYSYSGYLKRKRQTVAVGVFATQTSQSGLAI